DEFICHTTSRINSTTCAATSTWFANGCRRRVDARKSRCEFKRLFGSDRAKLCNPVLVSTKPRPAGRRARSSTNALPSTYLIADAQDRLWHRGEVLGSAANATAFWSPTDEAGAMDTVSPERREQL